MEVKATNHILIFLMFAYGITCMLPAYGSKGFCLSNNQVVSGQQDNNDQDLPFSPPKPSEPSEPADSEDDLSQDDKTIVHLSCFLFLDQGALLPFHNLTHILLSGVFNPPFLPPEMRHA